MSEQTKVPETAKDNSPAKSEQKKKSKPGFFKRIGNFFKEYKSEMKKVVWYPFKDVIHDTGVVVAALIAAGVVIGVLDFVFSRLVVLLSQIG